MLVGFLQVSSAVLFVLIGREGLRRQTPGNHYLPALAFAVFWFSTGAFLFNSGLVQTVDRLWQPDLSLHLTETVVNILLGSLALFCLTYYFLFLSVAPKGGGPALAVFYAMSAIALIYLVQVQRPIGLSDTQPARLVYADELSQFSFIRRMMTLLFLPPLLGLITFTAAVTRIPTRIVRVRVLTTTGLIVALFLATVTGRILSWTPANLLQPFLWIFVALGAFTVLYTYHAPLARPDPAPEVQA